jgi:hypothetical protein
MALIHDKFHGLRAMAFLIGRDASGICERGSATAATQPDGASSERHPHALN